MPALHPLQFVSGAREHQQEEEVGHRPDGGFGLSDADGFDEDVLVAGRLAEQHRLAGPARDAAEVPARRGRTDERPVVGGEPLHPRLVPENAAARDRTGRIDGEDRDGFAEFARQVGAERFDEAALADAWHAGDADAARAAGVRQARLDDLGRQVDVGGQVALHERDRAGEHGAIAVADAGQVLGGRQPLPPPRGWRSVSHLFDPTLGRAGMRPGTSVSGTGGGPRLY